MPEVQQATRTGIPTHIGRFRIVRWIGGGQMGTVYAAVNTRLERPVALKVLRRDFVGDADIRARFYQEAKLLAGLVHPNIVTVFDCGEEEHGQPFIEMQLLEGAPLKDHLKRPEASSLERRLDVMIQLCEGLSAAHAAKIVHRDLKPSNLFVQTDGLLKILDFGVARVGDGGMTVAGTMIGTAAYMSPEQTRGESVDNRSDIFAAGSVFYFILSGRQAFPGPDLGSILEQVQVEEPPPLRDVPPELSQVVSHAMAKSMADRPQRIEDVLGALVRFRQQYRTDTRRLIATARSRHATLLSTAAAVESMGRQLGVPEGDEGRGLRALAAHFPWLGDSASVAELPSERARVEPAMLALDDCESALAAREAPRRRLLGHLDDGQRALAASDPGPALRAFEQVVAECPESNRARELAELARGRIREQQLRSQRIQELLQLAEDAGAARDWATAIDACGQVLTLAPSDARAVRLLRDMEAARDLARRETEAALRTLLDRALQAIDRWDFEAAERALEEADALEPRSPAVADAWQRLSHERVAAEHAARLRRATAQEIRQARAMFRRGRYHDAIERLRQFVSVNPAATDAARESERLVGLRDLIAGPQGSRRTAAREWLVRAAEAQARRDLPAALAAAREALRHDPACPEASELVHALLSADLETQLAEARARNEQQRQVDAGPLLDTARAALERGYVALALDTARAAQRIAPDLPGLPELVERARLELSSDDAELFDLREPPPAMGSREGVAVPAPAAGTSEDPLRAVGWGGLIKHGLRRTKA